MATKTIVKQGQLAEMLEKKADLERIASASAELNRLFDDFRTKYGDSTVNVESDLRAVNGLLAAMQNK